MLRKTENKQKLFVCQMHAFNASLLIKFLLYYFMLAYCIH